MVPSEFLENFQKQWDEMLNSDEGSKIKRLLAIDGKTQQGNGGKKQKANHIVSAVDEKGFCLGQERVEEKTNEIKAIPELLDSLNIKGTIITTDAMGTQTAIVKKIRQNLVFVDICRNLLNEYTNDIPIKEAQHIERDITFMELSFYDYLNQWQEYLDLFEYIFLQKRTDSYISTYSPEILPNQNEQGTICYHMPGCDSKGLQLNKSYLSENQLPISPNDRKRFGRYLVGRNNKGLQVHSLYLCEDRRAIIQRKLTKQQQGKM